MQSLPLTFEESRLWVEWKLQPDLPNNLNIQFRFNGLIDIERLNLAFSTTANFFDAFRTYFVEEEGIPYKRILSQSDFRVDFIDLTQSNHPNPQQLEKLANQCRMELLAKSFDFTKPYLFNCNLIKFSKTGYFFVFVMPHILCDAYSINLFLNLLARIYNGGEEEKLKIENEYRFRLIEHDNNDSTGFISKKLETKSYWGTKFDNAFCQVEFNPLKKSTSKNLGTERFWLQLPINLVSALKKLTISENTSLFNIFAAVISILLYRYFGQSDISLGYATNVRPKNKYTKQLFGFFVNELGLRIQLSKELNFNDVLSNITLQRIQDRKYQDFPLIESLLTEFRKDNPGLKFPFNVSLVQTSFFRWDEQALKNILIQPINDTAYEEVRDGLLFLYEDITSDDKQHLEFAIDYSLNFFDANFIQQLALHFVQVLEGIVANPRERIDQLELLTEKEKRQLLIVWNQTEQDYPSDKTLHELFVEQVNKTPDGIAVVCDDQQLTYAELNQRSNQLARYIQKAYQQQTGQTLEPDSLIGLCVERSLEMIISILAILKAGGAYVPIDPNYPLERIHYILEDTQAQLVLTQETLLEKLQQCDTKVCLLAVDKQAYLSEDRADLPLLATAKNLAYVIYTSGTTGKPKGVMVEHQGLVNQIAWMQSEYGLIESDRILQKTPYTFDVSVWELLWANCYGASIVFAKPEGHKDSNYLYELINKENITVTHFVPSMLEAYLAYLISSGHVLNKSLRYLFCGGEALKKATVLTCYRLNQHKNFNLYNLYGPTEASIDTTYTRCYPERAVTIGKPIQNTQLYILSSDLHPVPIGAIGELYIGGAGLARGYLNRPELTAERFIPNPFATELDKGKGYTRLYKTGDLVRYLADGNIEYIGRSDFQVKLRGYRIELGEIENVLSQYSGIRQTAVLVKEREGSRYLVAYYVAAKELDSELLRDYLSEQLPEYMVPSVYVYLSEFPLTVNGKLNRGVLPEASLVTAHYVAPRTTEEQKLCAIWEEVLKIKPIGITDDFFRIGGDSILSIQLSSKSRQQGIHLSVKDIFDYRTIEKLAKIDEKRNKSTLPIERDRPHGMIALTPIQNWFFTQNFYNANYFNQSKCITLHRPNVKILGKALNYLTMHHDVFRMRFIKKNNQWQGHYLETNQKKEFEYLEISNEKKILTICNEIAAKFNLVHGPLYHFQLFKINNADYKLYLIMHHLIVDEVSWHIIVEDLSAIYQALVKKQVVKLIQSHSYQSWSNKLKDFLTEELNRVGLHYWSNYQVNQDTLNLSQINYEAKQQGNFIFILEKKESDLLLNKSPVFFDTDAKSIVLFPLLASLYDIYHKKDLIITLEEHGRTDQLGIDVSKNIGWFTNIYPVIFQFNNNIDFMKEMSNVLRLIYNEINQVPEDGLAYFNALYHPIYWDKINSSVNSLFQQIVFNYLDKTDSSHLNTNWVLQSTKLQNMDKRNHFNSIIIVNASYEVGKFKFSFDFQGLAKKDALILFQTIQKYYDLILFSVKNKRFRINREEKFDNGFKPIITVNPFGRKKPLILIYPGNAGYEAYLNNLCKIIDRERKLLLINNYNLYSGKKKINSITELAKKYVRLVKRYQPFGPYNLLGWSFGGLLSYEMASILEAQGDIVSNIFLLDPVFIFAIKDQKLMELIKKSKDMNIIHAYQPLPYHGNASFYLFKAMQYLPKNYGAKIVQSIMKNAIDFLDYNGLEDLVDVSKVNLIKLFCHHNNILDNEYITVIANLVDKMMDT